MKVLHIQVIKGTDWLVVTISHSKTENAAKKFAYKRQNLNMFM